MVQNVQVLDQPRNVQTNKLKKKIPQIRFPHSFIYSNGSKKQKCGLPHDWLDDPLVALASPPGPYTLEDAEEYLDTEPVEFYNGWLVKQEMSDFQGKKFEGILQQHLGSAACLLAFGQVLPDQMECLLKDGNVLKPDLSLISWKRSTQWAKLVGPNDRPTLMGSPEFLVEIRSPSNRRVQEKIKRERYFANGAEIIWDVDEKEQIIYVYRVGNQEEPTIYRLDDEIDCEPLLPGWRRQVSDLFDEQPSVEVMFSEVHEDGKQIGEQIGEQIGKQDMLIRLLQARFPDLPKEIQGTIKDTNDVAQLDNWFDQALMAQALDELSFSNET